MVSQKIYTVVICPKDGYSNRIKKNSQICSGKGQYGHKVGQMQTFKKVKSWYTMELLVKNPVVVENIFIFLRLAL